MTIQKISTEEFEALNLASGRAQLPETSAVRNLDLGEAIKFPCRWNHNSKAGCNGLSTIRVAAIRQGITIRAACRDGTVYVMRVA